MDASLGDVTLLFKAVEQADKEASAQLYELMYGELRRLAKACMRRERCDHTLQPTALINEVYIRLTRAKGIQWQSRSHFAVMAATVMRRVLVDHARSHAAEIRDGGKRMALNHAAEPFILEDPARVLAVHEALGT
jgi:RNA polymerase sigma factor (TIGR02999 family)